MRKIKYLDMFSGIGGFRAGLSRVGDWYIPVGYCEIDTYAKRAYEAMYDTKGEKYYEDARRIDAESLPDIDLICGGFPCQSFSVAGKRGGFEDARGTLFFEIVRIAAVKRPAYLLLENVPGLLSHDRGRTFAVILNALSELGYDVTWQVLNSADFGIPHFRKRVFIIGYLGEKCAGEILSFQEINPKAIVQRNRGKERSRVYDYKELVDGSNKISEKGPCAYLLPERETIRQQGRRIKNPEEPMFTLTAQDIHGIVEHNRIRKLMPIECWRLQGFTDEQFYKAQAVGIKDSQLYKMAGNAVSVPIVEAIGEKLRAFHETSRKSKKGIV